MASRGLLPSLFNWSTPAGKNEDPFTALQRQMNELFANFGQGFPASREGWLSPAMDVKETDKDVLVSCELPGVEQKDVEITLSEGVLTIKGEKKAEKDEKKGDYRVVERSYGSFQRQLALPGEVDPDKVDAKFKDGVLTLTLPRPAEVQAKVKKIAVKAA